MGVIMNQDVVRCSKVNCTDANHLVEIENVYKQIAVHSSKHLLKVIKMAHETARNAALFMWRSQGKSRFGPS